MLPKSKTFLLIFFICSKNKNITIKIIFVPGGSCLYIFTELAPLVQNGIKKLLSLAPILMKTILIPFFSSYFFLLSGQYFLFGANEIICFFLFLAVSYFYMISKRKIAYLLELFTYLHMLDLCQHLLSGTK